jgi:hypothetical protein
MHLRVTCYLVGADSEMDARVTPLSLSEIRLRLCDSGIIHTQKYYRTACSMQSSSDQLKNFPRGLSPIFRDWLPCLTMTWFRRLTSHNHIILLCPIPCWRSNLSHQPHASPKSGPALTARSNHSRAFLILRSAQYSRATVQITSGSVSHFLSASTLRALRCGRASDQIAIDQSMPVVGHSCSARASNAFPWAGAPERSSTLTVSAQRTSLFGFPDALSRAMLLHEYSSRPSLLVC